MAKVGFDYQSSFFRYLPGLHFHDEEERALDIFGLVETLLFKSRGAQTVYDSMKEQGFNADK